MDQKDDVTRILEEIRSLIKQSDLSQRKVEIQAGFSKGYLSQLLAQNLDLKVKHLLAILDVFSLTPMKFFARVYPAQETKEATPALDRFIEGSSPLSADVNAALGQLYSMGVESLTDLRRRLERCERAVAQLEGRGLVDPDVRG